MTTATSPYAILTGAGEWVYDLRASYGDPPLLRFNDADEYGCLWVCDEPEGWASATMETPLDGRQFGDGAYAGDSTLAARVLSWEGLTTCPTRTAQRQAMARLRSAAQSRVELLYTQDEVPTRQSLWVRGSGAVKMRALDDLAFSWSFGMVAEDPLKFDAAELNATQTIGLPQTPPGRVYNRIYNYLYGAQAPGTDGTLRITNAGDEYAQAVYTILGPVDRPRITNITTGQTFALSTALGAGDQLVVDTAAGLVLLNGTPYYEGRAAGSSFPLIAPGLNTLRFSTAGATNTTATLSVNTASTWK